MLAVYVANMDEGSAFFNFTEGDNITLTCAARNIQGPIELPYSSALTITLRVIQSIFYFVIFFGGLFLNTLVIVLVAKYKKLQTLSFLVSLQVVVLDWFLSISILTGLSTNIANKWIFGEYGCAITGLIFNTGAFARTFLMCTFVIDRYLAIVWPYFYPKYKLKVTVSLSVASWVLAVLVGVGMLPGLLDCYIFQTTGMVCATSSQCNSSCSIYVRIYSVIAVPATILPITLYGFLYYKARKIQKELASNAAANATHRKEWKATITFSLLFLTLIAVVLPLILINLIIIAIFPDGDYSPVPYTILVGASSLFLLLTITDPIVIMRDKDVKEVLAEIKNACSCKKKFNTAVTGNVPRHETSRTTAL